MKIFDCFMFFNERDIVYLRIKELYNHVDYFVINESTTTHQGQPKELSFWKDERLQAFKNKIVYKEIHVDGRYNHLYPQYFPDGVIGAKEHEQRIRLLEQIKGLNPDENDLIMISDCDEIPNKNIVKNIKNELNEKVAIALNQMFFVHYINLYTNKNVTGTVCIKYKYLNLINDKSYNMGLQILRRDKDFIPRLENGGWHYSYMGGEINVSKKVVSTYDGNLNSPWKTEEKSLELINEAIQNKKSPFSAEPLELLNFNSKFSKLNFITAIQGRWERGSSEYQIYPDILENNGKNEFKNLIYTNE
jgi:beta-1,4-mannosyl-glycoprotein beta-1,4-N-acetylglucosaminyltransferase